MALVPSAGPILRRAELRPLPPSPHTLPMPELARRCTVADLLAFPEDGNRYELIRGELFVSPTARPRHQEVIRRLVVRLSLFLDQQAPQWRLVPSPADISWDDETLVQPDLFVVPAAQASNDWSTYQDLVLAVEVISPSSRRADRVEKRRLYQERGIGTYWIVDHESEIVEVWRPGDDRPEVVTDQLRWSVGLETQDLVIRLAELFGNLPE